MKRILHIAPFNTANVPYTLMQAERELGYDSRLITLGENPYGLPEDICLRLPFLRSRAVLGVKRAVTPADRLHVDNVHRIPPQIPRVWQPGNWLERKLIQLREALWRPKIRKALVEVDIGSVDVVELDGGLEFYRDGRLVRRLKEMGKKIICCYTGSDLRVRGVIPEIDRIADVNVTVEFDHIYFHPNIHHVFFPFDVERFSVVNREPRGALRIGHAPTNRAAKGSDRILAELKRLQQYHAIEIVLIENLPYQEALKLKATCDIFVDQIGDLGYGINSLEALAMGIPVATSLVRGFSEHYPDHPFIEVTAQTLAAKLQPLLGDPELRRSIGLKGREWVAKYHDPVKVVKRIHALAGITPEEPQNE